MPDDGLLTAIKSKIEAGGHVQLGVREAGRIRELEEENVRMSFQLKQLKNVMAVSQGASDAYLAVVAKLHEDDPHSKTEPANQDSTRLGNEEAWGDGVGSGGGGVIVAGAGSRLASAKRGQVSACSEEALLAISPFDNSGRCYGRCCSLSNTVSCNASDLKGPTGECCSPAATPLVCPTWPSTFASVTPQLCHARICCKSKCWIGRGNLWRGIARKRHASPAVERIA